MTNKPGLKLGAWIIILTLLSGCLVQASKTPDDVKPTTTSKTLTVTPRLTTIEGSATYTPFSPATQTSVPPTANAPTATVPTATPIPIPTATPGPIVVGPTNFPSNVDPLTGLIVENTQLLDRRPVIIKVANYPATGRPHSGLSLADIVFEYYIGAGANRFAALYYGKDATQVGPMRSGRLVDAQLVPMYQGILGFVSAYATVYSKLITVLGARAITGPVGQAIYDDGRNIVISVFSNTAEMTKLATSRQVENKRFNLDGMAFDSRAPEGGQTADQLAVNFNIYNRGEWRYDPASGKYLRWIEELDANNNIKMIPLVDKIDNKQLAFSNVVVLFASYTEFAPTLHDIEISGNTTGRRALLYRDGVAIEAVWKSVGADKPIQFFTKDGKILPFKPGNSWIILTGINSTLKQPSSGKWELTFFLP
jgi:hypothetical protein